MNSPDNQLAAEAARQAAKWKAGQKTPEDSQEMAALKPAEKAVEVNLPRKEMQNFAAEEAGIAKPKEVSPDRKAKQEAAQEKARLAAAEDEEKKAKIKRKMRFGDAGHIKKMTETFRRIKAGEQLTAEELPLIQDVEKALDALIIENSPPSKGRVELPTPELIAAAKQMISKLEAAPTPQAPNEENAPVLRPRRDRRTIEGGEARSSKAA